MTESEILEYISKPPVKWVNLFMNNYVPEHIILANKQKIFKGDSGFTRAYEITEMFKRQKVMISEELFLILFEYHNANFSEIFDALAWVKANPEHNYAPMVMLSVCKDDPNSHVELFELFKDSITGYDLSRVVAQLRSIDNDYKYNDDIHEIFRNVFLKNSTTWGHYNEFIPKFVTIEEFLDSTKNEPQHFFKQVKHLCNVITEKDLDYILEYVHTNFDGAEKNPAQIINSKSISHFIIDLFKDHKELQYIKDMFTLPEEKLSESDYDEIVKQIMNNELSDCKIFQIIKHPNVPFSFLQQIQPKLIQLMLIRF